MASIVISAVGVAVEAAIIFFFQRTFYKRAAEKDAKEKEERLRDREEHEKAMKYDREQENLKQRSERREDIQTALKPLDERMNQITEKVESIDKAAGALSNGTQASLRTEILDQYYDGKDKGYRTRYDSENMHDMFEAYKNLGGNSFIEDVMQDWEKFPLQEDPPKEEKKPARRQRRRKSEANEDSAV